MGLVTFNDGQGTPWRVWRVDLPSARAHLMDAEFRGGWLVFERLDERERRRLPRAPDDWSSLSHAHLAALCAEATPVSNPGSSTSEQLRVARPPEVDP